MTGGGEKFSWREWLSSRGQGSQGLRQVPNGGGSDYDSSVNCYPDSVQAGFRVGKLVLRVGILREISEKFPRIFRHSAIMRLRTMETFAFHLPGFAAGYFFSTQWQMRFRSIGSNLFLRNHGICPSAGITRCPLVAAHVVA